MNVTELEAKGLKLFEGSVYPDGRGYFMEMFKESQYAPHLPDVKFIQDNLSWSKKGVIRGLHLQIPPNAQGKFVRCLSGRIYDVVVDLRKDSRSFKKWFGVELDGIKNQVLYIPPGFAHGFQALEEALVVYKCTTEYSPKLERGIRFDTPELAIVWPLVAQKIVSEKDLLLPTLNGFNFDEL